MACEYSLFPPPTAEGRCARETSFDIGFFLHSVFLEETNGISWTFACDISLNLTS